MELIADGRFLVLVWEIYIKIRPANASDDLPDNLPALDVEKRKGTVLFSE